MSNVLRDKELNSIVDAIAKLGFQICRNQDPDQNVVLSPIGIMCMMVLLHTGARGRTHQLLARLFDHSSNGEVLASLVDLLSELEKRSQLTPEEEDFLQQKKALIEARLDQRVSRGEIHSEILDWIGNNDHLLLLHTTGFEGLDDLRFNLSIATSMWVQQSYTCRPAFMKKAQAALNAQLDTLDFEANPEQACDIINAWANKTTRGLVELMVSPATLPSLLRVILANTVYFSALWVLQFSAPRPGSFYVYDEAVVQARMIGKMDFMRYVENNELRAVFVPYRYRPVSMVLILPKSPGKRGLIDLELSLLENGYRHLLMDSEELLIDLAIPEFEIDFEANLKNELAKIGLGEVLGKGDYSGISEEVGFGIDAIVQKAKIQVDRYGTKAAAAIQMSLTGGIFRMEVELKLDRPFLYLILDEPTNTVLFAGRVVNPL